MKNSFASFCLLIVLFINCVTAVSAQNTNNEILGEHYVEKNVGFSMYIPKNWELIDFNQKYLVARGPAVNNYSPNITFGDEQYSGPISDYINAVLSYVSQIYADFEILQKGNFITNSGLQGEYVTFHGRINEIIVRQRLYVIPNSSRTVVMGITGTAGIVHGDMYDSLFDECVKTFDWTK
jgi:hypothetical protein